MNIVEALKIAKDQGVKVRPVGVNWCVVYESDFISGFFARNNRIIMVNCQYLASPEEILKDWEVVKEKPSKETQYKIDSMKFQVIRYCKNKYGFCAECKLNKSCMKKQFDPKGHIPTANLLDDWSLKEIVEAYHILKKEGDI